MSLCHFHHLISLAISYPTHLRSGQSECIYAGVHKLVNQGEETKQFYILALKRTEERT